MRRTQQMLGKETKDKNMFVQGLLLSAMVFVVAGVDPCEQYANGCSTPLHLPMAYKDLFTPSCNRHDVCYRCGAKYGIARDDCDSAFLSNMKAACATDDSRRRDLQKRDACVTVATDVYYGSVHLFGGLFYREVDETESYCSEPTARSCLPQ